eukprot:Rmarinus@m.8324
MDLDSVLLDDVDAFRALGIQTTSDIFLWDRALLCEKLGWSAARLNALFNRLYLESGSLPQSGLMLYESTLQARAESIPNDGIAHLDSIFTSCVRPGEVVELIGDQATGKSQACMTISAAVAACGRRVIYLDTANAMSPQRIAAILPRFSPTLDPVQEASVLSNIQWVACHDTAVLLRTLHAAEQHLVSSPSHVSLVVVDGMSNLLQTILTNRSQLGWMHVTYVFRLLKRIARVHSAAVVATKHFVRGGQGQALRPALGSNCTALADTQLALFRSTAATEGSIQRNAIVVLSPRLRTGSTLPFSIEESGVQTSKNPAS